MSNFSLAKNEQPNLQDETVIVSNPFDDMPSSKNPPTLNTMRMPMMQQRPYYPQPPPYAMNPMMHRGHVGNIGLMGPRIYPADQALIRSTNPNAPPIYPCGVCHFEIHDNEQALHCMYGCKFFFHRSCVGMTEEAFTLICNEPLAEWICDNCLTQKQVPSVIFTNS